MTPPPAEALGNARSADGGRRGAGASTWSVADMGRAADKPTDTSSGAGGALRPAAPATAADRRGAGAAPTVVDRPTDLQPRGLRRRTASASWPRPTAGPSVRSTGGRGRSEPEG